jgi:sn-glycerol 3-phosphate transport system permease protein
MIKRCKEKEERFAVLQSEIELRKRQTEVLTIKQNTKSRKSWTARIEPYMYLLPTIFILVLFAYYPFVKTGYMSMSLTDFKGEAVEFIGIQHYTELIESSEFKKKLAVTFQFVLYTTIPSILGGLFLGLLAHQKTKGIGLIRTLYALPMAVSSACAAVIWMLMYHPTTGFFNKLLGTDIGWLSDEKWALLSVATVTAWMNLGFNFLLVASGLQNISKEYYESAAIDGANSIQILWKITIPLLTPTIFFITVTSMINSFQAFGQINIMTAGGPSNSTNVLAYAIYQEAFVNNRFGVSSALSIILFVMMFIITLLQFRYEKKWVHYQ